MSWIKKAQAAKAVAQAKETEVTDEAFTKSFPALAEFMLSNLDGDQPRELCKLQVFAQGGVWKAALHDPNSEASLFTTLSKPQEAFAAIDKALRSDAPDWRFWQKPERGKGRKRD